MGARFSFVRDDGAGALLGLAAGDQGAGAAYGHDAQLAIVVAYELLRFGEVDSDRFRESLVRLAGGRSGRSRLRGTPIWLHGFIEEQETWHAGRGAVAGIDVATRAVPVGIWHRNRPDRLVDDSVRAARATHRDRGSAVAAAVMAGTIAGISHGQYGRDLAAGALEVGRMAARATEHIDGMLGDPGPLLGLLERLQVAIGEDPPSILQRCGAGSNSLEAIMAAVAMGAPLRTEPFSLLTDVAPLRRRDLEVMCAAIVGGRVGLIRWPGSVANDTWFAEIGRRLAAGTMMVDDLPDLFEVEERLSHGPPGGLG
jgi:hypothetical protein